MNNVNPNLTNSGENPAISEPEVPNASPASLGPVNHPNNAIEQNAPQVAQNVSQAQQNLSVLPSYSSPAAPSEDIQMANAEVENDADSEPEYQFSGMSEPGSPYQGEYQFSGMSDSDSEPEDLPPPPPIPFLSTPPPGASLS